MHMVQNGEVKCVRAQNGEVKCVLPTCRIREVLLTLELSDKGFSFLLKYMYLAWVCFIFPLKCSFLSIYSLFEDFAFDTTISQTM